MKKFIRLYKEITKTTEFDILRPVDLPILKEHLMDTEPFEGVIIFNPIFSQDYPEGTIKTALYRPNIDKLNKVVFINTIQLLEHGDEPVLMIACKDGTVIRPDDDE